MPFSSFIATQVHTMLRLLQKPNWTPCIYLDPILVHFHSTTISWKHKSHQPFVQHSSITSYYIYDIPLIWDIYYDIYDALVWQVRWTWWPPFPTPALTPLAFQVIQCSRFFPIPGPVHILHPLKHPTTLYTANSYFILHILSLLKMLSLKELR